MCYLDIGNHFTIYMSNDIVHFNYIQLFLSIKLKKSFPPDSPATSSSCMSSPSQ